MHTSLERQFADWVALLEPIIQHSEWHTQECHQIRLTLAYFDVPEFWREPVRVMVQGAYCYGADEWMASIRRRPVLSMT
jgi:hypothetical protein